MMMVLVETNFSSAGCEAEYPQLRITPDCPGVEQAIGGGGALVPVYLR